MSARGISTHVLDTALGKPAAGIEISFDCMLSPDDIDLLARDVTDADGRVANLFPEVIDPGLYRLRFATGDYFRATGQAVFYPEVVVYVQLEAGKKYHLPLLLSPFGYSTYRGS